MPDNFEKVLERLTAFWALFYFPLKNSIMLKKYELFLAVLTIRGKKNRILRYDN